MILYIHFPKSFPQSHRMALSNADLIDGSSLKWANSWPSNPIVKAYDLVYSIEPHVEIPDIFTFWMRIMIPASARRSNT